VPVPLLAVVHRLPQNMDLVASCNWYRQYNNDQTYPFDFNNEAYQRSLNYYVSENVNIEDFKAKVLQLVPDSLREDADVLEATQLHNLDTWKAGQFFSIYLTTSIDTMPLQNYVDMAARIESQWPEEEVKRLYNYETSDYSLPQSAYLSVNFATLDSIRAFETYVKENFNVQIEMSQVNSKENFNAVSVMANILSFAMIVFSMVCIIMFIVNMLQSYFQKVKRNLGTFKAFGIDSNELIRVYVMILLAIVATAVVMALAATWLIQLSLPLFGLMKDGEFNYLSLWSMKTVWSIIIVALSTVITVYVVMSRLLKQTPGDLIYDR